MGVVVFEVNVFKVVCVIDYWFVIVGFGVGKIELFV